jgi:hypothetical protein
VTTARSSADPPEHDGLDVRPWLDRGHQGDVDVTQIDQTLRLTPIERLRRHERWRLFAKEALARAELRRAGDPAAGGREG